MGDTARIMLNLKKPNNYAFFCPAARVHLTISNPVGMTDRVTSSIARGIKMGSLLDVDGRIDLKAMRIIPAEGKQKDLANLNGDDGIPALDGISPEPVSDTPKEKSSKKNSRKSQKKDKKNAVPVSEEQAVNPDDQAPEIIEPEQVMNPDDLFQTEDGEPLI